MFGLLFLSCLACGHTVSGGPVSTEGPSNRDVEVALTQLAMKHTPPSAICELDASPEADRRTARPRDGGGLTIQLPRLDGWSERGGQRESATTVLENSNIRTSTYVPEMRIRSAIQSPNVSVEDYLDATEGGRKTDATWRRIHTSPRFACGLEGRFMVGVRSDRAPVYEVVLLLARDVGTDVQSAEFVSSTTDPSNEKFRDGLVRAFEGLRVST